MELSFLDELKLRYVSDNDPGYIRRKRGKTFVYETAKGERVTDEKVLQRIKSMVIPPMWEKVWICRHHNGHIQVTGLDAKKRKQYLYHPAWTEYRQGSKFQKMTEFARFLPLMRAHINTDLHRKGWPKEKVLALVVHLLDEAHMRIGNLQYRDLNQTYGLTTLRRRHMTATSGRITFNYKAKSGIQREIHIVNKSLVRLIKQCAELPGYEVFKYLDEEGKPQTVDSYDVNNYLKNITGENFSAKDFRTWGGTKQAVRVYPQALEEFNAHPRKTFKNILIKMVATKLGNTIKVCESYYIHPNVLNCLLAGRYEEFAKTAKNRYRKLSQSLEMPEVIALNMIENFNQDVVKDLEASIAVAAK
jgi:DNA topoisomerase-1